MDGVDQIRRSGGALRACFSLLPVADPQISNREALRLETEVTQTKQTTQPHSNREKEALFSRRNRSARHPKPRDF